MLVLSNHNTRVTDNHGYRGTDMKMAHKGETKNYLVLRIRISFLGERFIRDAVRPILYSFRNIASSLFEFRKALTECYPCPRISHSQFIISSGTIYMGHTHTVQCAALYV